jgi:hypothetical protein
VSRERSRIGGMSLPPDISADGVDWLNMNIPCGPRVTRIGTYEGAKIAARSFAKVRGCEVEPIWCKGCGAYHVCKKRQMSGVERVARAGERLLERTQ